LNLVGSVKAEVLCPAGCVVLGSMACLFRLGWMWVISQARADEVVELAVREPDGILHRLERASPKIRWLRGEGEPVGRATDRLICQESGRAASFSPGE
jgi:hypothetical protein